MILAATKPKLPREAPRSLRARTYSMWEYCKDKNLTTMKNVVVPREWVQMKAREFAQSKLNKFGDKPVNAIHDEFHDWESLSEEKRESMLACADAEFFDRPNLLPDSASCNARASRSCHVVR